MNEILFLVITSFLFLVLLVWGLRSLPEERWQILAVIPVKKEAQGYWRGSNLTFYGFLIAGATATATLFGLILLQSAAMYLPGVLAVFLLIFAVCLPASKLLAGIIEKKLHTFTVGGAFFCGLLFAPWAIVTVNSGLRALDIAELDLLVVLAALAISYVLGEGLGRLACVSFGCCYGKPLKDCHYLTQKIFNHYAVVFTGATKKAAYEGGLEGEKLIPIQGLTCTLFTITALISTHLFLQGHSLAAFLLSLIVSQLWRFISETMRADFRGFGRISVYQKMSLIALPYAGAIAFFTPTTTLPLPAISQGLSIFMQPTPMISVQLLWVLIFFFFGRSMVTSATVSFQLAPFVNNDKI
jgi:hypothetical protein